MQPDQSFTSPTDGGGCWRPGQGRRGRRTGTGEGPAGRRAGTGQAARAARSALRQAATQITEQASDLRSVGESLREQGKEGPAKAADQLAQYAEKVGGYLREKDSHALLSDAEDFGRRQPWAIAAGGLALGFAASRFLKASSSQRYHGRTTVPRPNGVYPAAGPTPETAWASGHSRARRVRRGTGDVGDDAREPTTTACASSRWASCSSSSPMTSRRSCARSSSWRRRR